MIDAVLLQRLRKMFTDIQARVREQPFVPLRIAVSSGQTFDIHHPDLIMVGCRSLIIGTASTESPTQYEQATRVAILHVTALEDLPSQASAADNGPL
jgi:hypothetical protein